MGVETWGKHRCDPVQLCTARLWDRFGSLHTIGVWRYKGLINSPIRTCLNIALSDLLTLQARVFFASPLLPLLWQEIWRKALAPGGLEGCRASGRFKTFFCVSGEIQVSRLKDCLTNMVKGKIE